MIRALLLVLVALGCERAEAPKEQPKPPPQPPVPSERVVALDHLRDQVQTTERKRSPVEAPVELTNAYADLALAYGYARLGARERAHALVEGTRSVLPADPVHTYLRAAYAARIETATKPAAWPDVLRHQHAGLERVDRYKVDRLRERSAILEPSVHVDAIAAFSKKVADIRGPEFEALAAIDDPAAHVAALGKLVDSISAAGEGDRARLARGALDELRELAPLDAEPLFARCLVAILQVPDAQRTAVDAAALVVAARLGKGDAALAIVQRLDPELAAPGNAELVTALPDILLALHALGRPKDTAFLTASAERGFAATPSPSLEAQLVVAAAGAAAGHPAKLVPVLDAARDKLATNLVPGDRSPLLRAYTQACVWLPTTDALARIDAFVAAALPRTTDSFGTNSHYALSVLELVDAAVLAIVGA